MIRRLLIFALFLVGCGSSASMPGIDAADDAGHELADLGQPAGDGAIAQVDAAGHPGDASSPGDAAQAPADLAPACGATGGPCCAAQLCTQLGQPNGTYCAQGTCSSSTSACWMIAGVPSCEPCGGVGQWCCGGGAVSCRAVGSTCAGPSSASANHCS